MKGADKRPNADGATRKRKSPRSQTVPSSVTPVPTVYAADGPASEDAELFALAKDAVAAAQPEAERREKIAALKRRIEAGNYSPSAEALAEKVLEEHLETHFGKNSL